MKSKKSEKRKKITRYILVGIVMMILISSSFPMMLSSAQAALGADAIKEVFKAIGLDEDAFNTLVHDKAAVKEAENWKSLKDQNDKLNSDLKELEAKNVDPKGEKLPETDEINAKRAKIKKNTEGMGESEKNLKAKEKAEIEKQEKNQEELNKRKKGIFQDWVDIAFDVLSVIRGLWIAIWGLADTGTCTQEKPYTDMNATRCRSCNEDPYRLCTKERCTILGKCIPVQKQNVSGNPNIVAFDSTKDINFECVPGECKNYGLVAFKAISATWALSDGTTDPAYAKDSRQSTPSNISLDLGLVEYNTKTINITVLTDQLAKCRYIIDKAQAKFEEMNNFDNNDYPNDGSENMNPVPQYALIYLSGSLTRDENHTIYIKCANICPEKGTHNQYYDHNKVKFKFKPKPDSMWPAITFLDPDNNAVVSDELTKLNVSIWLDENGVCAYATKFTNWNTTFNNMTLMGEGTWKIDPYYIKEDLPVIRTRCIEDQNCTELKRDICAHCFMDLDLTKGFNEINWSLLPPEYQNQVDQMGLYNVTKMFRLSLRCRDASPQKNTMPEEETLNYVIMTMPPYNITITLPENDTKTYDPQPEIQVISGSRNTQCKYLTSTRGNLIPRWNDMTYIDDSTSTTHSGKHNETLQGDNYPGRAYTLYALCRDQWSMESRATAHFSVIKDTKAPIMIRTYHDSIGGSYLIIETNEISTCSYTYDRCNFNYSQGAFMIGDNQTIHSAYWAEKTMFIKCQDEYGNFLANNQQGYTKDPTYNWCTAILRPFEVPIISS